jgi:hypothetical protein
MRAKSGLSRQHDEINAEMQSQISNYMIMNHILPHSHQEMPQTGQKAPRQKPFTEGARSVNQTKNTHLTKETVCHPGNLQTL